MLHSLQKPFTFHADFFMPPNRETSYRGVLTNSPGQGVFLELYDLPMSQDSNYKFPIICGRFNKEPYTFTLINVVSFGSSFSGNPDGLTHTTKLWVTQCLLGKQILNTDELVFNQIGCEYSNLREWINEESIITKYIEEGHPTKFLSLPDIKGSLDNSFDFSIQRINAGSYAGKSFEISISQVVTFNIVSKENKLLPLENFLQLNTIIKYFFMFMQNAYVAEESIFCKKDSENIVVDVIQFLSRKATLKKLKNSDFKYPYSRISMKFERLIQKWIEKYKEMPDFFHSFFENVINEHLLPYDRFENLVQALFFYYNYKFDDTRSTKKEYDAFFTKMRDKLDNDEKEFVDRFRGMGNQLSMKSQLEKIFLQLEFWKANPSKYKTYIDQILEVRNRIAHSTENVSNQTIMDANNMSHNLTSFISSLILFEIKYYD